MDEFIRFRCPSCEKRLKAPRKYAARKVRCSCGQSITAPDVEKAVVPAVRPTPVRVEHTLQRFSAGLVMFLGLVTFNMFAMIRLFWLHGNFPIRRPTDPTAARAIIGALIPGFNLVWAPFALGRLVTRLNEQRRETGLPELRLNALVAAFVVCMVAGPIATFPLRWLLDDGQFALTLLIGGPLLNWLLIVPMLASSIQNGINALVDAAKAPGAKLSFAPGRDSAAFLVKTELQWRSRQRTAWGIYLSVFGIANFTIICLVLFMDRNHDGKATVAIMNFLFVSLPFFLGASTLFVRAWLMAARRKRLDREPEQAFAMVAAERRTTMLYQLFWGGVFA